MICRTLLLTFLLCASGEAGESRALTNPLRPGADPWVVRDPQAPRWLWCEAERSQDIVLRVADTLTARGERHRVWRAAGTGPAGAQVWAPELHLLDGRWHIYFAASDGRNETHQAFVLRADTADPLGSWTLHGPLATGDGPERNAPQVWAIDMTVLTHDGKRYAIWSGWDAPGSDHQFLYLARMASPLALTGPRVRLCRNDDYLWERTEERPESRGLNEGPQVLTRGGRTFLVYSCGASWLPTYKLGLLELTGRDPMDPAAWQKHAAPVFTGTDKTFGVGHSCFVNTGDQWWHIYHAKRGREPGWARSVFLQPFHFDATGFPIFGEPAPPGTPLPATENGPP